MTTSPLEASTATQAVVRARPEGPADLQAHALGAGIASQRPVGALGHPTMDHGGTNVGICRSCGSSSSSRHRWDEVVQEWQGGLDQLDLRAGDARGADGQYVRYGRCLMPVVGYRRGTSCAAFAAVR